MSAVRKGILALVIANVIWGFASPIFKWSLVNIPPYTLAFLRFFLGTILLGFYLLLTKQLIIPSIKKHDWWLIIWYALTAITLNIIFFFLGLQRTLSINAPIIASAQPIIIFLIAPFLLKETVTRKKAFGMGIGTVGILVIILEPILLHGVGGTFVGNFFILLATIAAVAGTLIGRVIMPKYNPIVLTFLAFIIGTLTFIPFALYEYIGNPLLYSTIDMQGIIGIAFGAIFSSAIAYTLFCYGLAHIPASEASIFTYIDPIAGTTLSYFMLHEPITVPFILGAVLIFGGISIAEGRLHYHPLHRLTGHRIGDPDCVVCESKKLEKKL